MLILLLLAAFLIITAGYWLLPILVGILAFIVLGTGIVLSLGLLVSISFFLLCGIVIAISSLLVIFFFPLWCMSGVVLLIMGMTMLLLRSKQRQLRTS
jgi:hypothetical protein